MPLTPDQRAKRVIDIRAMYEDRAVREILTEYLKYEHAIDNGIRPQYSTPDLEEMVAIHYEALRAVLLEKYRSEAMFERAVQKYRAHLLRPLHYANH